MGVLRYSRILALRVMREWSTVNDMNPCTIIAFWSARRVIDGNNVSPPYVNHPYHQLEL